MKKFFIFILLSGLFLCFSQHAYAKIVFASKGRLGSDNFDIWLMNDDGTLVRLTNDPADERCPHFSPDGSKVAYTRYGDGIRIIDLETMEDYRVPNTNGGAGSNLGARPRPDIVRDWGPCNKILFCNEEPVGMGQVWEINPDGSGRRQITFEPNGDSPHAAWSPDCSMIAFSQGIPYIGGSSKVCTAPVSYFDSTTIYDSPHNDHVLDWSPDGSWILFNRFGVGELWIVSPSGQNSAKVISTGKHSNNGVFTSDGRIVYSDHDNIYVTDLSGSEIHQLTSGPEIDTSVDIWGKVPCKEAKPVIHTHYKFKENGPFKLKALEVYEIYLKWDKIEWEKINDETGIFPGFHFFFESGQGGYIGLQLIGDKKKAIFSIWDQEECTKTDGTCPAEPSEGSEYCSRFTHEGTGTKCLINFQWKEEREYKLTIAYEGYDSEHQRAIWIGKIKDMETGKETVIGRIALLDQNNYQGYGFLEPDKGLETFLEYFLGGCENQPYSRVIWRGPYAATKGEIIAASFAKVPSGESLKCCQFANAYAGWARPLIIQEAGGYIKRCFSEEENLWKNKPLCRNQNECYWNLPQHWLKNHDFCGWKFDQLMGNDGRLEACPNDSDWGLLANTWDSNGKIHNIDRYFFEAKYTSEDGYFVTLEGEDYNHATGTIPINNEWYTSYSIVTLRQGNIWSNTQCWYCPEELNIATNRFYIDINLRNREVFSKFKEKWHVMHAINTWLEDKNKKMVLDIIFHRQGHLRLNPCGDYSCNDYWKAYYDKKGRLHYAVIITPELKEKSWTNHFINLSLLVTRALKESKGDYDPSTLKLVQAEMLTELRKAKGGVDVRRFDILYFDKVSPWLFSDDDHDGVSNEWDIMPLDYDADDDGLIDGPIGREDLNTNGIVDPGETDPINPDTDGDGIFDGTELGLTKPEVVENGLGGTDLSAGHFIADADPSTTTDPTNPDTDGDGLLDGEEDINKNGALDIGETSPILADTDGDGYSDGEEVAKRSDPLDPNSVPAITGDLDNDGDIDQNDLNILLTYRNQPASACPECDLDGDGVITVLDARKLVLMCTRPRCATE